MKLSDCLLVGALAALASCGPQRQPQRPANDSGPPELGPPSAPPAVQNGAPTAEASKTNRTSLAGPDGPNDPKSLDAAGQVVQHYLALIEQGRWTKSRTCWSDAASAKRFERSFRNDADVHAEIGDPGDMEGAAGSSYVTVPVTFYGKTNGGADYRRKAEVVLRRVNDVPGSTAEQRQWRIESIEWKAGG